jgi:hypothetical protein
VLGLLALAAYLALTGDWRCSWTWALAVPAIAVGTAWALIASNIAVRFPKLTDYLLYPRREETMPTLSRDEWDLHFAAYAQTNIPAKGMPFSAAEDGLICVPVLLLGIDPISALVGGIVFGLLHLARFSYQECLGKAMYYSLAIYFVLPHGLVSVVLGHFLTNALAVVGLRIAKQRLAAEVLSNSAQTHAPQAARR